MPQSEYDMIDAAQAQKTGQAKHGPSHSWWRVLLTGFLFFFLGLVVLILTGNPNLFPTVVLLGSLTIPATYVVFFYDHRHLSRLTLPATILSFFYGGILGTFAAALLEPFFIQRLNFFSAFQVGLIEEFVKILGVLVIARHRRHDSEVDGLIFGVAAGMGFAALESIGYAFVAFLGSGGSLSTTVGVTLLRGILSPLGHGTWTALLAAVLFREAKNGHFRLNLKVVGAYLTVVVLHGLWDGLPSLMSVLPLPGLDFFIGEALVGAVGLFLLWRRWREALRLQVAESAVIDAPSETAAPV